MRKIRVPYIDGTETDTSQNAVRIMQKRLGSTPFPDGLQGIADDASLMIAALLARVEEAEEEIKTLELALGIVVSESQKAIAKQLTTERDTAWNDAIEAAANSVKRHAEIARRRMREAYDLGADRKVVDGWSAIISHMDNEEDTIRALRKGDSHE